MVQYDNHWPEHLRVAFHVLPIVAAVGALELRLPARYPRMQRVD